MFQEVVLIGRLGRDAEIRTTQAGTDVATLNIVTERSVKRDNKYEKQSEWHRCVVFGGQANFKLDKGMLVFVRGHLQTRKWTDKDGIERYSTEVVAEQINSWNTTKLDSDRGGYDTQDETDHQSRKAAAQGQGRNGTKPKSAGSDLDDDIPF